PDRGCRPGGGQVRWHAGGLAGGCGARLRTAGGRPAGRPTRDARQRAVHGSGEPDVTVANPLPKTWSPAAPVGRLDIMLVGDTSFGENYQEHRASSGRENVLETHGYDHAFERLDGLLEQADLVVANLETPLTRRRSSPFADIREFLHYSDPDLATKHLLAHGIRAVTLANNHTHDFGEAGLLDTLRALESGGLLV